MFGKLFEWYAAKSIPRFKLFRDAKNTLEQFLAFQHTQFHLRTDEQRSVAACDVGLQLAESKFKEAIDLSEQENRYFDAATARYELGMLYHAQGRYRDAKETLSTAIEMLQSLPQASDMPTKKTMGDCHYHLGIIALLEGDRDEATRRLSLSRETDQAFGDYKGAIMAETVLDYMKAE